MHVNVDRIIESFIVVIAEAPTFCTASIYNPQRCGGREAVLSFKPRHCKELLLGLLRHLNTAGNGKVLVDCVPVDDMPPLRDVLWAPVLILQVVCLQAGAVRCQHHGSPSDESLPIADIARL